MLLVLIPALLPAQTEWKGKFEQLDQLLPTPNEYRSGSGSPGPKYWQQKADYSIEAELHDDTQSITGSEVITYHNNSPDVLTYLWMQLDMNIQSPGNTTDVTKTYRIEDGVAVKDIARDLDIGVIDGGYKIFEVSDTQGKSLPYTINQTMMRVDLPLPLKPGASYSFSVKWKFDITDRMNDRETGRRMGKEYFPDDGNYVYIIGHWFPRMCVYDDYLGWQNKQFLGQGEFTLPFGDYRVKLTVPSDHIVGATGEIQNIAEVLSGIERERFEKARQSLDRPFLIVTQAEATAKESKKSPEKKTWVFEARNVRDFAFASSRKFIWDAQAVKFGERTVMAMSLYPKEGNPLWEKESTKAVRSALITYSTHTIDYPYPVAYSVHSANLGMEYPMICFNGARPNKDGTYSDEKKWALVGVVIHEVGHNFFPMIINNDERQWAWMDEGVNTFVQYLTQVEHYPDMNPRRGPASRIVPYMRGDKGIQRPLMFSADNVVQSNYGNEQYAKCATALNILRETVMGRELFDKSFKEYAQRWAFKHPKPGDFFRTLEDASAVDLDWFWRGWFYSTDNTDMSIENVKWYQVRKEQPNIESRGKTVTGGTLASSPTSNTFAGGPQPFSVLPTDRRLYGEFTNQVDDKALIQKMENKNFYEVTFKNKGGLVMPVIVEWTYKDGTKEIERIPAEIWRADEEQVTKVFMKEKEVVGMKLDPLAETADVNSGDNQFPRAELPSRIDELKKKNN